MLLQRGNPRASPAVGPVGLGGAGGAWWAPHRQVETLAKPHGSQGRQGRQGQRPIHFLLLEMSPNLAATARSRLCRPPRSFFRFATAGAPPSTPTPPPHPVTNQRGKLSRRRRRVARESRRQSCTPASACQCLPPPATQQRGRDGMHQQAPLQCALQPRGPQNAKTL